MQKMKNYANKIKFLCLLLSLFLVVNEVMPVQAVTNKQKEEATEEESTEEESEEIDIEAGREIISIDSAEKLYVLANRCQKGMNTELVDIQLQADLDMTDYADFDGIQSFSGHFHGNGYSIAGVHIENANAAVGFFGYLEKGALVDNLTLKVDIASDESSSYIGGLTGVNAGTVQNCNVEGMLTGIGTTGGIAGLNGGTGIIIDCRNEAYICSLNQIGGIAGQNRGVIEGCLNAGMINAGNEWLEFEDNAVVSLTVNGIMKYLTSFAESGSDIGGIAGWSVGTIEGCANEGTVGYLHAGRNVGGIAGRFCGQITDCANRGKVFGKQDVGGIAGQFEPCILEQEGESIKEAVQSLKEKQEKLNEDIASATDAVQKETDKVSNTVSTQSNNVQKELDKQKQEADKKQNTVSDFNPENIKNPDMEALLNHLDQTNDTYNKMVEDINQEKKKAEDASNELSSQVEDAYGMLNDQLTSFTESISSVSKTINYQTKKISDDISEIDDQLTDLENLAKNRTDNLKRIAEGGDLIQDYSAISPDNEQASRIRSCVNTEAVNGDRNVGGIAGALAIDGTDVEDGSKENNGNIHMTLAVLEDCKNSGIIVVKKANGGGIVGNSDLGLIRNCLDEGYIVGKDANFLGGIAGNCQGTIATCNSLTVIEGSRYVGGIAGTGKSIRHCYSMPVLIGVTGWQGAILGDIVTDRSEDDYSILHSQMFDNFYDNYYVSETLFGINGISYEKAAQEISYKDLTAMEDAAKEFSSLHVVYLNEEYDVLGKNAVQYGEDFSKLKYPESASEEEEYVCWNGFYSKQVVGNVFLQAAAQSQLTTLASEMTVDDKPMALVSGLFTELSTFGFTETTEQYLPSAQDASTSHVYEIKLENAGVTEDTITKIRILNTKPDETVTLYYLDGTEWVVANTKTIGSYMEASFSGDTAAFCVKTTSADNNPQLILKICVSGAALACLMILVLILRRKRNKRDEKTKNK